MERLKYGREPTAPGQIMERFKRLKRQFKAAARKDGKFSKKRVEEMLRLDNELASMNIGWRRNFSPSLLAEEAEPDN